MDDSDAQSMQDRYDDLLPIYRLSWAQRDNQSINFGYFDDEDDDPAAAVTNTIRRLADWSELGDGSRILDLGCAAGGSSVRLAQARGATVVGIDLNDSYLDLAREHAAEAGVGDRVQFQQADFHECSGVEGPFDVVWSLEALSHTPRKGEVFERSFDLLAPGGRMIFGDLFGRSGGGDAADRIDAVESGLGLSLDPIEDVEAALADAGFVDVERLDVTSAVLPGAQRAARTGRYLGPVAKLLRPLGVTTEAQVGAFRAWREVAALLDEGAIGYDFLTARRPGDEE